MKKIFYVTLAAMATCFAIFIGFVFGFKRGQFQAGLEENKIARTLLNGRMIGDHELAISSEFREYLKGRIYYNIASKYPNDRGYLYKSDWDFGKVDRSVFNNFRVYVKDPSWSCDSFEEATSEHSEAGPLSELKLVPLPE